MLTARQFDLLVEPIVELFEAFQTTVVVDIARRLARLDYTSTMAAHQIQRIMESGALYDQVLKELAVMTGKSERTLRAIFQSAGIRSLRFDDAIYRAAGLDPVPLNLSPAMSAVLAAGLRKTQGIMQNLTSTTALTGQQAFERAADLAYLQVSSGAMSYQQALQLAVKKVASDGLTVIRFPGRVDQLDVAMRRTVLTGIGQTVGELTIARANEMDADLVQVSAHIGARNTGDGPANHESWQGKIYSRSGRNLDYGHFETETGYGTGEGLHGWNCVLGDTLVSGPAIRAAYRRKYSGEIIVIRTARGHELTVSPNHPILTDKGWVAAGLLGEGDNVISCTNLDGISGTSPNVDQYKTRIEDVFNSLSERWNVLRFPVSSSDFHGDVSDSKVDVVFPDGLLGNGFDTSFAQQVKQVPLCGAVEFSRTLVSKRPLAKVFFRALRAAHSIVSRCGERYSLFWRHSFQALAHGIRSVFGKWYAKFLKVLSNSALGYACLGGNFIFPHAGVVHGKQTVGFDPITSFDVRPPVTAGIETEAGKSVLNGFSGAAEIVRYYAHGHTGIVELDNVVFIERKSTQGSFIHVYNLETEGGWYFANGIITHNCRHSFFPFFEGVSAEHYQQAELDDYADKTVAYNGREMSVYEASQQQRYIERRIRHWKRQAEALEAAGLENGREMAKVREWQARMRDFIGQTGLQRQRFREQVFA